MVIFCFILTNLGQTPSETISSNQELIIVLYSHTIGLLAELNTTASGPASAADR